MDGDQSGLNSYYHHRHPPPSAANGLFSDPIHHPSPPPLAYPPPHSLATRTPPPPTSSTPPPPPQPEVAKRKRGRPRKYGNPDAPQNAASSAKKASSATSLPLPSPPISSSKKNQISSLGSAGQNFTPHLINVTAGEDVAQKIMLFIQKSKRAVCILSASGSISNASLRQPATSGCVTYEGRFEILSLSGSFVHTETEGGSSRIGGINVCMSGTDGRIIGGGVAGPLKAACPVQVIIGSFVVDTNKETNINTASPRLPQGIGQSFSNVVYHPDDSCRITPGRNNDHQNIGVNSFMLQSQGMGHMPSQSTEWRDNQILTDHGGCQSSEDGDNRSFQH